LIARNNKDLLFTPPNDPEILADNILKILNDQELKKQFEVNVRNKVEKKFTWNAHYFNIIKGLKNKLKI
jgi:glycosyltransferase involved in cell wall biosynthesis